MDRVTLESVRRALRAELVRLELIKPCCASCVAFVGSVCEKFDAVPSAEVVAVGCDDWQHDGVPF